MPKVTAIYKRIRPTHESTDVLQLCSDGSVKDKNDIVIPDFDRQDLQTVINNGHFA